MAEPTATSALVLIGPGCPHCAAVVSGLTRLIKDGRLGSLEVVNLAVHPERAHALGVKSVPWTRIGPFELVGALSPEELADWAESATQGTGWAAYYAHMLDNRRLREVIAHIRRCPSTLSDLLGLLTSDETRIETRIAISAVVEELEGTPALEATAPVLEQLTLSESPQVRADACHFLGLTRDHCAIPAVRRLLEDEDRDVREIALETLAMLGDAGTSEARDE